MGALDGLHRLLYARRENERRLGRTAPYRLSSFARTKPRATLVRRRVTPPDPPIHCWELDDGEETARAWARWRRGAVPAVDGGFLAVSTCPTPPRAPGVAIYRLVCSTCGAQSAWFEATDDEITLIGDASTLDGLRVAARLEPEDDPA